MRAGKLRDTIIIQKQTEEQNEHGAEVQSYNDLFKARADVKVISGVELLKAGVAINKEVISILMRYNSKLKHDHVVSFNSNIYEVLSIKPKDKYSEMIVSAERQIT